MIVIPDEIIDKTGLSESDLKLKIAILLFAEEKMTLCQASDFCGLHQFQFQKELAKRKIPIHYGINDLKDDIIYMQTIR